MKKITLIIITFTLLSKIFGFSRDIILSYIYGATNISDAYLIAYTIPGVFFAFIGTGVATSFIPLYSEIERSEGANKADLFTSKMINLLFVICTIFIALGIIFCYPLVKIFAAGFTNETLDMAVGFTRISLFGIYISIIIHVLGSYLNLKNNFYIPVLIGVPFNLIIITSIILSKKINLIYLPFGIIVALLSQLLIVIYYVRKSGFRYNFSLKLKDRNIVKLINLSIPVILGVSVNQVNVLIDRTIASTIDIGAISALNYANRLNLFIQGIFVISFATAMYPLISKLAVEKKYGSLKKILEEAIIGINLLVIPSIIGIMIFSKEIVSVLFGRGAFGDNAITVTSSALFYYTIGMLGYGLREILSRTFYSLHDTKTPMVNAAIGMTLNIVLNIMLSRIMGVSGLALATSISAIFTTTLLFVSLRKKIGSFGLKRIIKSTIKILISSLLMAVVANFSYNLLLNLLGMSISLFVSIILGGLSYFIAIYFMKIDDVKNLVKSLRKKT